MKGIVVGSGYIGTTHANCYSDIHECELIAIVDANRDSVKKLAYSLGVKWYTDFEAALAIEKPDFVDICLPTPLHYDFVTKALHKKIHVLVEKPFAPNPEICRKLLEEEAKSDARVMVAHVCRFMKQYAFAKSMVESGKMGKPIHFRTYRFSECPNWSVGNWINDKKMSGGTLMDLSIHDLDIANWLFGYPKKVYYDEAVMTQDGPAQTLSILTYPCGVLAQVEASHLMPAGYPFSSGYTLVFEEGTVEFSVATGIISIYEDGKRSEIELKDYQDGLGIETDNPYMEEIRHFAKALMDSKPFRTTPLDATKAIDLVYELRESQLNRQ